MTRARWGVERLEDLVERGFITRDEWMDLVAAQEHLWIVRNHLHVLSRRRHDRLTFEDQESVAGLLGYRDGARLGVEQFMQTHYRRARSIARLVDRMPERARRSRRKPPVTIRELAKGVLLHDSQLTLRHESLTHDPAVALRLYSAVADEGFPPDPIARDVIAAHTAKREFCQALRREPEAIRLFCELLTNAATPPLRRGSLLEELHEVGLVVAMVPELEAITGRVPHDAYHTYTADVHALLSVDRLRAIARGELATEFPVVSRCAAELPRPLPVYVAALLSELGAGQPDAPAMHAASLAGSVCERLGLSAADTKHVQWLIANQHSLYHWALRRDISDPDTIAEIAREVETVDRLRDLYLLTFCTVSTANPAAMTAWNARMLVELWMSVSDVIEGRRVSSEYLAELHGQVLALAHNPAEQQQLAAFLAELPERYLLANSAPDILAHARFITSSEHAGAQDVLLQMRELPQHEALEVLITTADRPGLLADLTAALSLQRFEVVSAQLYTRKRAGQPDEAFDLFLVRQRDRAPDSGVAIDVDALRKTVVQLVTRQASAAALLERLERRSRLPTWARTGPRIKTEIGVDNQASKTCTVVDVYTRDRPELLYTIAHTLHSHGLTISLAKVNTEGRRVADVFYVQADDGGKLATGQLAKLSDALRATINKLDG